MLLKIGCALGHGCRYLTHIILKKKTHEHEQNVKRIANGLRVKNSQVATNIHFWIQIILLL
jgi:hypothetical protein